MIFRVLELCEPVLLEKGVRGVLQVREGLGGSAPTTCYTSNALTKFNNLMHVSSTYGNAEN